MYIPLAYEFRNDGVHMRFMFDGTNYIGDTLYIECYQITDIVKTLKFTATVPILSNADIDYIFTSATPSTITAGDSLQFVYWLLSNASNKFATKVTLYEALDTRQTAKITTVTATSNSISLSLVDPSGLGGSTSLNIYINKIYDIPVSYIYTVTLPETITLENLQSGTLYEIDIINESNRIYTDMLTSGNRYMIPFNITETSNSAEVVLFPSDTNVNTPVLESPIMVNGTIPSSNMYTITNNTVLYPNNYPITGITYRFFSLPPSTLYQVESKYIGYTLTNFSFTTLGLSCSVYVERLTAVTGRATIILPDGVIILASLVPPTGIQCQINATSTIGVFSVTFITDTAFIWFANNSFRVQDSYGNIFNIGVENATEVSPLQIPLYTPICNFCGTDTPMTGETYMRLKRSRAIAAGPGPGTDVRIAARRRWGDDFAGCNVCNH